MTQLFNGAIPGTNSPSQASEIRDNFNSLFSTHSGPIAPSSPVEGTLWWNSSLDELRSFDGSGWVLIAGATASSAQWQQRSGEASTIEPNAPSINVVAPFTSTTTDLGKVDNRWDDVYANRVNVDQAIDFNDLMGSPVAPASGDSRLWFDSLNPHFRYAFAGSTQTLATLLELTMGIGTLQEYSIGGGVHLDSTFFEFDEISVPSTPSVNTGRLYSRDVSGESKILWRSDAGTEYDLTSGGGNHNLLSATHPDTVTGSPVLGDLIGVIAGATWTRLPIGTTDDVLTVVGGIPVWQAPGAAGGNTLDQAYDQGGAGVGRQIIADTEAVEIQVPSGGSGAALDLDYQRTTGVIQNIFNTTTTVLAGALVGLSVDLATNITAGSQDVTYARITLPATTGDHWIGDWEDQHEGAEGVMFRSYKNSPSPADSDYLYQLDVDGNDDGSTRETFGSLRCMAQQVAAANEHGRWEFYLMETGSLVRSVRIEGTGRLYLETDTGKLIFNRVGGNNITIQPSATPSASRIYSLPDIGFDGTFAFLEAAQTWTGVQTLDTGGAIDPNGIAGEVRMQTSTGIPGHTASKGVLYQDTDTDRLYLSTSSWTELVLVGTTQTLTNKILTLPTIDDFTNATHDHQDAAGGGQLDHGLALLGLGDDDHTQYALLAGRSGGQTLRGGSISSENLILESTAGMTKGVVRVLDVLDLDGDYAELVEIISDPSTPADGQVRLYAKGDSIWKIGATGGAVDLAAADSHNLLSSTHPDTIAASPVRGDLIGAIAGGTWTRLPAGPSRSVLAMDAGGNDPEWTRDLDISSLDIDADSFTFGLTNKLTLQHILSSPETITFPDSSGTVVLEDLVQTLTNKTVSAADNDVSSDREEQTVRKGSVGTIVKGSPVYITGFNPGGWVEVEEADATLMTTMPSVGIANESITNAANAQIVRSGEVAGLSTSLWLVGDSLYVSETSGMLTNTKPTGVAQRQSVGIVLRSHATLGVLEVFGAGRVNDIPNFTGARNMWQGSSDGTATEVTGPISTIVGTTDAQTLVNKIIDGNNNTLTVLETQITDGSLLARVASAETITGGWLFSTALTRFADDIFGIDNPAGTFPYIFSTSAIGSTRSVTLPLLTDDATFAFIDFAQTFIAAHQINAAWTMGASGSLSASGVDGEIIPQTGAGAPAHSATEGTIYWDTTGNSLYINNDGATGWTQIISGASHNLLSSTHTDTIAASPARGDLIGAIVGATWTRLPAGTANQVLTMDTGGNDPEWNTLGKVHLPSTIAYEDEANDFGTNDQRFGSGNVLIENPAGTFTYAITGSAIAGDRVVTIPLLTAPDTFVMEAFGQTLTNKTIDTANNTLTVAEADITDGTILARVASSEVISGQWEFVGSTRFNAGSFQIDNPAQTFQYIVTSSALAADRILTLPLLGADATFAFIDFAQTWAAIQTIGSAWTMDASGSLTANGIAGEIIVQTFAGTPVHSATEGTLCWDTTNDLLYCNNDGATAWTQVGPGGGAAHNLLSSTHPDTIAASPARGDLLGAIVGATWTRLPAGTANQVLTMDTGGNDPEWNTLGKTHLPSEIAYEDESNDFGTNDQRFGSGNIKVENPAGTQVYSIVGSAIASDFNVTLPLLLGSDIFVTEAFAQTLTNKIIDTANNTLTVVETDITDGSLLARVADNEVISGAWEFVGATRFNAGSFQIDNPAQTFQYIVTSSAIAADRIITLPLLDADATLAFIDFAQTFTAAHQINAAWTMGASGSLSASGVDGEIIVQTFAGIPVHSASEGTLCWDTTNDILYCNDDGATGWTQVGPGGGASHNLLSSTHPDTIAASPVRGDLLGAIAGGTWTRLPIGAANAVLFSNSVEPSWSTGPTLESLSINGAGSITLGGDASLSRVSADKIQVASGDTLSILEALTFEADAGSPPTTLPSIYRVGTDLVINADASNDVRIAIGGSVKYVFDGTQMNFGNRGATALTFLQLNGTDDLGGRQRILSQYLATGTITADTIDTNVFTSSREDTTGNTLTDDYDAVSVIRTSIANHASSVFTADGSVFRIQNIATQTLGSLIDNVRLLELIQDSDSNGNVIDAFLDAEANPRFELGQSGEHRWGDGAGAVDTQISRVAANILELADGDTFRAGTGSIISANGILGEILIQSGAGVPSHSATEGTLYFDTTGDDLYANTDGATTWAQMNGGGAGNTLDQAYDEGGAGAGRTITTSDGAVEFALGATAGVALLVTEDGFGSGSFRVNNGGLVELGNGADFVVYSGDFATQVVRIDGATGDITTGGDLVFDLANDVTITATNPAAPRTLTIPDPGGNDSFVFLAATQTLSGKTLDGVTIGAGDLLLGANTLSLNADDATPLTTAGLYRASGNTILNAASGQSIGFAVAGTNEIVITATNVSFENNNLTGIVDLTTSGDVDLSLGSVKIPSATSPSLAAGQLAIDTTQDTLHGHDGTQQFVLDPVQSKSITIEDPGAAENIVMFRIDENPITIVKVVVVVQGTGSPTVDFNLRHGTDRSAAGTDLIATDQTESSTTTGTEYTTFADATLAVNEFLWLITSAVGGTTQTELHVTVFYRTDT